MKLNFAHLQRVLGVSFLGLRVRVGHGPQALEPLVALVTAPAQEVAGREGFGRVFERCGQLTALALRVVAVATAPRIC